MRIPSITNRRPLQRLLAFAALFAVAPSLQAQPKIATVNLQNVFTNYFKTKQADSLLQEHGAEAEKVLKGWLDDYQKANEDYKKLVEGANDQAVAAEERDKRKKAAESKVTELKELEKSMTQFKSEAKTRIDEQKIRLREKILGELIDAIAAKAKRDNYSHVFDISGSSFNNGAQLLLYSNGQNDLTSEILTELNAKAPPGVLTSGTREEKPAVSQPKTDEKPPESVKPAPSTAKPKKK